MAEAIKSTADIGLIDKTAEYSEKIEANELNLVSTAYTSLLNLGVSGIENKNQRKYIRICNFLAINSFAYGLAYLIFAIFWEKWYWFGADVALCCCSMFVLAMNNLHKTGISRLAMITGINIFILLNSLLTGTAAHNENFFIVSVIIPFLVYDLSKWRQIAFGVALPVFFMMAYTWLAPYFAACNADAAQQLLLYRTGILMQILLAVLVMHQFVLHVRKAEKDLETSHTQMGAQTTELKRSNADLEQFAYIISHDLKAPVRNISSFMNLLATKHGPNMPPDAREFVEYSRAGAKRMERLIEDILSYCRIGTNLGKPTPVNLNEVVNTVRFELRERLANMNGSVTVVSELPVVNNVHQSLMYHVFQNLITNGLKFNKSEKPEITINYTNSLNYYTFSVHDNGIGISKEFQATVFQMFKRLHTESEYEGTGIGLAIVKKIVSHYNGEIWFESQPGQGTTFNFTIRKF